MKTVLVCTAQAPFITGGAEILVSELRANLERRGFRVDVAAVPFKWYPVSELIRQALAWRLIDVTESNGTPVDLVIPTKFPSFLVRHPRKVAWLFHQHREAYDLFGTPYCSFRQTPEDLQVRDAILAMDTSALSECRAIYTISRNVAERLRRYNGLCGEPLYPPPHHLGRYRTDGHGDYLFYAGRLDRLKRLDLAVDAMQRVRSGAKLKIAGAGPLAEELRKQIEGLGVADRVELLGFVTADELIALYAGCRAAYYAPLNEDYGYVTVEAFLSKKPVVTTSDAGGVLEFVTAGETGVVAEPTAESIAAAIDTLWAWPEARLREMGEAGRARVVDITWDAVIDRLTESIRVKLAVWSPLPPSPSGIADYVAESLPALARHFDVAAVTEDPDGVDPSLCARVPVRAAKDAPAADLHLYHLGNSPAHAFVYRAARDRPGVVVLHDWSLHHLVLRETVERGDVSAYLREMRRAYGETGTFVGRQVARALGGDLLPALFPLSDRVLEGSLGVVTLSAQTAARVARRLPGRPRLRLPHHLALPADPPPSRAESRAALGLPADAFVITAPGLATANKRLDVAVRVIARIRADHPETLLVVAGAADPRLPLAAWAAAAGLGDAMRLTGRLDLVDFERHLAAADVVLALRFPSHGEMSGAVIRALGVGRPVLVSAGSAAAEEFPAGVVIPVGLGPAEEGELEALLRHLRAGISLRETIGALAAAHVRHEHGLEENVETLAGFLRGVEAGGEGARAALQADRGDDGGLLRYFIDEVRWGARELGLADAELGLGLEGLLEPLARAPRR